MQLFMKGPVPGLELDRFWVSFLFFICSLMIAGCGGGSGGGDTAPDNTAASIAAQPVDQTVVSGQAAQFTVVAANARTYQWQENIGGAWTDISGASQATYRVDRANSALDGRQYRVVVTGPSGSILSSAVTLRVTAALVAPSIVMPPGDQTATEGNGAIFNVTAAGTSLAYQWQSSTDAMSWTDVPGATSPTLTFGTLDLAENGRFFRVAVRNAAGSVVSSSARLTVNAAGVAPSIIAQPTSMSAVAGQAASLSVLASGTPMPSFRWQSSSDGGITWTDLAGATAATYDSGPTTIGQSGTRYRAVVENSHGIAISNPVTLTVSPAPVAPSFSSQPHSVSTAAGRNASFSGAATGSPAPVLQWQISADGATWINVNGATTSSLSFAVSASDNYKLFRLIAANAVGTAFSQPAVLQLSAASSGALLSLLAGQLGGSGNLDGTGTDSRFEAIQGVAVDSSGNQFVADPFASTIRRITPAGEVTTFAGAGYLRGLLDGRGSAARFSIPTGIAIDRDDNLYVADSGNSLVRKITPLGDVSTVATVSGIRDLTVSRTGVVYTVGWGAVMQIATDGTVTTFAGMQGGQGHADGVGETARFRDPEGITVDARGNLYVADPGSHVIRKITPAAVVSTLAGTPGSRGSSDGTGLAASFAGPSRVTVDTAGNLFVSDTQNGRIRRVTSMGDVSTIAGTSVHGQEDGPVGSASFNYPVGIAVATSGDLFVGDGALLRRIAGGSVSTVAGSDAKRGGFDTIFGPGPAGFNGPIGLAVASDGTIFVANMDSNTIRQIDNAGLVSTLAGFNGSIGSSDGTGMGASFDMPSSLAIDSAGNLIVADTGNHTIRRITRTGVVSTLAGTPGSQGSADGVGSAARFAYPRSVVVDGSGVMYVADSGSHTIRRIALDGTVSTFAGASGQAGAADGPRASARFNSPSVLALDGVGNLYVSDTENYTVRRIDASGNVTTLAGLAGNPGSADGNGASARFSRPAGLAFNRGALYVLDSFNGTLRRISTSGTTSTILGLPGQTGVRLGNDGRLGTAYGLATLDSTRLLLTAEQAVLVLTLP